MTTRTHYSKKGGKTVSRQERKEEKRIKKMEEQQVCEYNKIKKSTNVLFNVILTILSLLSVVPFIFVIIISLTDEQSLARNGYRFIPEKWSLYAYSYIIAAKRRRSPALPSIAFTRASISSSVINFANEDFLAPSSAMAI